MRPMLPLARHMPPMLVPALPGTRLLLPFFPSAIPAGFPSPADDYTQRGLDLTEYLITHPAATVIGRVEGDSMVGAGLFDGDLVLINRALEPVHDDIVYAIVNGEHTVKRLYRRNGVVKLVPANPKYSDILVTEDMDVEIAGVITSAIRTFRK